jgi:tRNA(Ile)-lysidine synthase
LLRERAPPISALTTQTINALFAPLEDAQGILLAVSGGPDSTALLLMAAHWARTVGRPKVHAATVDHGMREGSRAEAMAVAALCARLEIAHHSLDWEGPKPRSRIQELARNSRYGLLARCAGANGMDFIVTAHHADDHAETILFRLLRGSGIAGLAGMTKLSTRNSVVLARPLLDLRKQDLIAYCLANGESFSLDPSNEDARFARTKLRKLIEALELEGLGVKEFARLARRASLMEEAVKRATDLARSQLIWASDGVCDARVLLREPPEIAQRLLSERICEVGNRLNVPVGLEKMERLTSALQEKFDQKEAFRANVGGAFIALSDKGVLGVSPEPPRRTGAPKGIAGCARAPKK